MSGAPWRWGPAQALVADDRGRSTVSGVEPDAASIDAFEELTMHLDPAAGKVRRLVLAARAGLIGPEIRIGRSVVRLPDVLYEEH
jgi:hypothetical protein